MPNNQVVDIDKEARKKIVEELETNFFVEASAGSGKTTSLVYRMVALIEKGVPVDQICTITFTKAAADEFFVRFQKLLSIRSNPKPDKETDDVLGPKNETSIVRCVEALNNIDLCFLGTIDSFCNMVAHELPNQIDIPSDSVVISDDDRNKRIKEEYYNFLKDKSHPLHEKAVRFESLFYPSYDVFSIAINTISEIRNTEVVYDRTLLELNDLDDYFKDEKQDFIKAVDILCGNEVDYLPDKQGRRNKKYLQQAQLRGLKNIIKSKSWGECVASVARAIKCIKEMNGFSIKVLDTTLETSGYINRPENPKSNSSIKYSEDFEKLNGDLLEKIDEFKYAVLMDFATSAFDFVSKKMKAEGKFTFFDFLYYLTEAFKKSACTDERTLVKHIFERHSRFLLDESQDTNPIQTELFFYLTGTKKVINDDFFTAEPKEGSLFIVGDPKQSIYAFRNANVQAYLNVKSYFAKKNEVLVLTRNFRSNVSLKEWFNNSMDIILNHGVDALEHKNIPYDPVVNATNGNGKEIIDGVYSYTVGEPKDDPEYVAKMIIDLITDKTILNKKGEVKGDISFKDFLIVPISTQMDKYIETFNAFNIPMSIEAAIPFENSRILVTLKDLVYLLLCPNNRSYFMNVMFSDLFKFNELDIIQMLNDGFDLNIMDLKDKDGSDIVFTKNEHKDAINLLNKLFKETFGYSYSSMFFYLLNNVELNIFSKVDSSSLEYAYYLIDRIKEREEAGLLASINELHEYVEAFVNKDIKEDRCLRFSEVVDRVKIANLHKVKGLQAPIVILVKPAKQVNAPNRYVDCNSIPPKSYFSSFSNAENHNLIYAKTAQFAPQLPRWVEFDQAEKERLEYVAATRAESVLVVSNTSTLNKNYVNPWQNLYKHVPQGSSITIKTDIEPLTPIISSAVMHDANIDLASHAQSYKCVSPSALRVSVRRDNQDVVKDVDIPDYQATLMGTMVHKLMECLVSSRDGYKDIDELVNDIAGEYDGSIYEDTIRKIANYIRSGGYPQKNSSLDGDILTTLLNAKEVWCEVPFAYSDDKNNIVNGVIDLLYVSNDDKYHIIDYKTNTESDVSILEKEYAGQLNVYKKALRNMGVEADAHIYHIDLDL